MKMSTDCEIITFKVHYFSSFIGNALIEIRRINQSAMEVLYCCSCHKYFIIHIYLPITSNDPFGRLKPTFTFDFINVMPN